MTVVEVHGGETRGCRRDTELDSNETVVSIVSEMNRPGAIARALTSDNQGADDSGTELGGPVDERLRDKVDEGDDERPHAELVGTC